MKGFYFSFIGKKIIATVILCFFSSITFSQNVGVSDLSSFNPVNLFHIYKNSSSASTLFQISNSGSGATISDGLTFDVDGSFNISLNNREATSLGFNTSGTTRIIILSGGDVGIGTVSPGAKLDVQGAAGLRIGNSTYDANLVFGNNTSWKSGIRVYDNGDAEMRIWHANTFGQIILATGYNGDQSTSMPTDGLFIDQNKVGIGYASPAAATGKLLINGNVGIGTTTPSVPLDVTGTSTIGIRYLKTGSADARITIGDPTQNWSWATGWATGGDFSLIEEGTSGNRIYVKRTTGNVGIGTSNPSKKLDVTGDINFTGALYANGNAGISGQLLYSNAGGTNSWLSVGTSGQILISTSGIPNWQNPGGTEGYTRAVIPLASFGGEVYINSTSWQRVTRTTYTSLANLFSGVPVMSGYTRKYYVVIRKADNQPGGIGSYWRFACDGGWNGGNDVAGHGFSISSDWGSLQEGTTYWIEIPPTAVSGSGAGTQYWKIDAKMANASTYMRVMYVNIAAVDIYSGTNTAYSAATGGNATLPPLSLLYENVWSTGTSGNVGVGTSGPSAKLHVAGGGQIIGTNGTSSNTRTLTILEDGDAQTNFGSYPGAWTSALQIQDNTTSRYIWLSPLDNGSGANSRLLTYGTGLDFYTGSNAYVATMTSAGNVGIGTTAPGKKLDVQGGASFGSGTYQSGAIVDIGNVGIDYQGNSGWAGTYNTNILLSGLDYTSISFHDAGATVGELGHVSNSFFFDGGQAWGPVSLGINTRTPGYTLDLNSGTFAFGNSNVRTQTRTNAGLQGNAGAQSGFFENDGGTCTNYPAGASGWWHLIDCRHSNNSNNFALQIAGSFWDQDLYYRKTSNNPAQAWSKILTPSNSVSQIISSSLTSNVNFGTILPSYTDLGVSVTFTATKSTALVELTASGYGYTNSMSYVGLRVFNVTTGTSVGGTIEKIQNYDDMSGTVTTWSCSFSKLISGLTAGNSYTLKVQGGVSGILGTYNAVIDAASTPDQDHLTLNVIQ